MIHRCDVVAAAMNELAAPDASRAEQRPAGAQSNAGSQGPQSAENLSVGESAVARNVFTLHGPAHRAAPGDGAMPVHRQELGGQPAHQSHAPDRRHNPEVAFGSDQKPTQTAAPAPYRWLVAVPPVDHPQTAALCESIRLQGHAVNRVPLRTAESLADAIRETHPRIIVLHVDLLGRIDVEAIVRLRRQFPVVDWVIAWHSLSHAWVDLVVQTQARGCIDCSEGHNLARAIDTVAKGQFWFPRWVSDELYGKLIFSVQAARIDVHDSPGPGGAPLTPREADVMALMRQGFTNKDIARRLDISVNTVKKHLKIAFEKRGLHSRRQAFS